MIRAKKWAKLKNIICLRPDNMGDVLMTQPALRALKEQNPRRKITLLTSASGSEIAKLIKEIDEIIIFDLPWIKSKFLFSDSNKVLELIKRIKDYNFDAAVIFTNYSQNPLPSAMLAYLSAIPKRLAYCRENPYDLLTDWIPDKEPFATPVHGVKRQLNLVQEIGAQTQNDSLFLDVSKDAELSLTKKMKILGYDFTKSSIIVHPGASEEKRRYSPFGFISALRLIIQNINTQIILTGSVQEIPLVGEIRKEFSENIYSMAGKLSLGELVVLIKKASLLLSNNTGPVHIASAVGTPVVVLYADTNFDHTPWKVRNNVLFFNVKKNDQSRNQILNFAIKNQKRYLLTSNEIFDSVKSLF